MAQGKQAKVLTLKNETKILAYLQNTRYAARDTVMFLLSTKAGLRAKEIAGLQWRMITNADGEIGGARSQGSTPWQAQVMVLDVPILSYFSSRPSLLSPL